MSVDIFVLLFPVLRRLSWPSNTHSLLLPPFCTCTQAPKASRAAQKNTQIPQLPAFQHGHLWCVSLLFFVLLSRRYAQDKWYLKRGEQVTCTRARFCVRRWCNKVVAIRPVCRRRLRQGTPEKSQEDIYLQKKIMCKTMHVKYTYTCRIFLYLKWETKQPFYPIWMSFFLALLLLPLVLLSKIRINGWMFEMCTTTKSS